MNLEIIVEGRKTKVDMGKKINPTGTLLSKQPSKYLSSLWDLDIRGTYEFYYY